MTKVKHVLGISGGKDSAALAIYMRRKYPQLKFLFYYCDTGKELDETYQLIEALKNYLETEIITLRSKEADEVNENPFDFYYKSYKGYLPSSVARWCTKKMKLEPFEKFVGTSPVISYVGIRGDEDREGYISTKKNIQSIFPFRRNIWSEDVITEALANENRSKLLECFAGVISGKKLDRAARQIEGLLEFRDRNYDYNKSLVHKKLNRLLDLGIIEFNHAVFKFLKDTQYPLSIEEDYPLLDNDEVLIREDIFRILNDTGIGVPAYYNKVEFEVEGNKGEYARSRSGCYFCFFQQKIEWVWLYEQHPDLFKKAMKYENEKEGFTWNQDETLADLVKPDRLNQIKKDHLERKERNKSVGSPYLIDVLDSTENHGCAACFI